MTFPLSSTGGEKSLHCKKPQVKAGKHSQVTYGVIEGLMGQSSHSVQWKAADQPGKDVKEDNQLRKGEQWLTEGRLNK